MPILLDLEQDTVEARSACLCSGADDFWLSSVGPSDLLMRLRLHRTIQSVISSDRHCWWRISVSTSTSSRCGAAVRWR